MKITEKELDLLINKVKSSQISGLKYQEDDFKISIKNEIKVVSLDSSINEIQPPVKETINDNVIETKTILKEFKSPLIGNFYLTKDPDSPELVKVGDIIESGSLVCVIEAMKMISEVHCDIEGEIVEICVEPGTFVDLDTTILKLK